MQIEATKASIAIRLTLTPYLRFLTDDIIGSHHLVLLVLHYMTMKDVAELITIWIEKPILDYKRNLVAISWEIETVFNVISDQIHA